MTRLIPTAPGSCFAGLVLLVARAADFESTPTADESAIRIWRNADGLPSDSVLAVIQTRDGYLWIDPSSGLVRFDGVKFTEIKLAAAATHTPVGVTALCEDTSGSIWIGTQQNRLFQLKNGEVLHHTKARPRTVTRRAADSLWTLEFWCRSRKRRRKGIERRTVFAHGS